MVENTGNSYRTRQAVTACLVLIAIAVAAFLIGVYDVDIIVTIGIWMLIIGTLIAVMSLTFSSKADKFGPSEMSFRLIVGLVIAIIGVFIIMIGTEVSLYVCIAVLLIGIAVIGLCATLIGNKTSKY